MSQCYSGSFANLIYPDKRRTPDRQCVGFFPQLGSPGLRLLSRKSRQRQRRSLVAFIENLAAGATLSEAHDHILVSDQTPDVPLKTSDVYLEQLLEKEARKRGQSLDALINELLVLAWLDKSAWEPEIRLLDRIGQASGSFSPRSMEELQEQAKLLPEIGAQFATYGKRNRSSAT